MAWPGKQQEKKVVLGDPGESFARKELEGAAARLPRGHSTEQHQPSPIRALTTRFCPEQQKPHLHHCPRAECFLTCALPWTGPSTKIPRISGPENDSIFYLNLAGGQCS